MKKKKQTMAHLLLHQVAPIPALRKTNLATDNAIASYWAKNNY